MGKTIAMFVVGAAVALSGCSAHQPDAPPLNHWSFNPAMIFPTNHSLKRPEDGVLLVDGSIVVADQVDGLRLISTDGSSQPFGKMAQAGYRHSPPTILGAPNGVSFEPAETHILVCDIYRGGIYRVEIATEKTELIYQHPFGVNTARRDLRGGLWFTQSTRNHPENGEQELFRAVGLPVADGALYYMPPAKGDEKPVPVQLVEGLLFPNGIVLDETAGYLYLAETTANRVSRYRVDTAAGRVTDRTTILQLSHPDNVELDTYGRLWVASPLRSEIVVFDPGTGVSESVLRIATPQSEQRIEAIEARIKSGASWADLLAPDLWEPGPGMTTGVILPAEDGPVYVSGLGDALIRLER